VLPRAVDGPHVARDGARGRAIVVMTSNVFFGRADARAIVRLVREHHVDALSLQELTPEVVDRLDAAGIRRLLPGRVLIPRAGAAGSGLMARSPLRSAGPADGLCVQPEAVLRLPGGVTLRLKAIHPTPPTSRESAGIWRETLRGLPGPRAGGVPRILLGDFNGTLDNREIRRLLDGGYYDAADATGDGLRTTWPTNRSRPMITIDHVLVPEAIRTRAVSVHDVPGSDHRAVIAELVLPDGPT
ncbi:MAG: endonuclease/exonuclease/phosphatase family protein, partial [Solirubrobacteraceae bacterium]